MTKRKRFKHLSVFDRAVIGQKRKEGLSCGEKWSKKDAKT